MTMPDTGDSAFDNPQKRRVGLNRVWHATCYSLSGLKAALGESAFRQEAALAVLLLPLSVWVGNNWLEVALLCAVVCLVLIVELLNTAIEVTVDRIGPQRHPLSAKAKDLGSAAVLVSLLLCGLVWTLAIWHRFT